ncbi:hypothetical protein BT93_L2085 [Corymbia citriodora subsp. variegata]|uniref:DUF8204 domain-containing protein n=1 Tax=Corymbia citriodora subsp. variegata TaxID=360336 RepID=A0A8T0CR21_CORYI|nr:hypothetical protein BT93_L2085 [Corymbia citriodora subsp. variegata]
METNKGEDAGGRPQASHPSPSPSPSPNPVPNPNGSAGLRGKSCKGCLYYSSVLKSKSQTPTCVGFSRTLNEVPSYIVGESELEATKEGRNLKDFSYACVGYSVFLEKNHQPSDAKDKQAELPFCVGLEVLLDKRTTTAENVPANLHKKEAPSAPDGHAFPQRRSYKPAISSGDDYLSRFKRNASLVASGVARNVNRVGNYIKESVDDIFQPYRRRPK